MENIIVKESIQCEKEMISATQEPRGKGNQENIGISHTSADIHTHNLEKS